MAVCVDAYELSRTEIGRVADALEALLEEHGGRRAAAQETGVNLHTFSRFARRSAYERVTPAVLAPVAAACGLTVEQLLAGKGPSAKRRAG